MKKFLLVVQTLLLLATASNVQAQKSYDLKHFPKGCQPEEIGVRLTERYLQTPHSHWGDINSKYKVTLITYPDVCAWLGALWFTAGTGNDSLYTRLVERFEPLFTTQKNLQPNLFPKDHNVVDFYVFGAVPLEIYKRNHDPKYLELGMKYADGQWVLPENPQHYKQLSEGYEDAARFAVMQRVGMTKRDIRTSVNAQLRMVFLLPLLAAFVHLAFAQPMIWRILRLFGLQNLPLVLGVTACACAVFTVLYCAACRLTSNAYCRIVGEGV